MENYNEINLSYLAGIIDGEGSIGLNRSHWKDTYDNRYKTPSYVLRVKVCMKDEIVVKWIHSTFGGKFYHHNIKGRHYNIKTGLKSERPSVVNEWTMAGREAIKLLKKVYPYLKLKKPQAEIAFEFAKTLNKIEGYQMKLPDNIVIRRTFLRSKMVELNSRNKYIPPLYDTSNNSEGKL